MIDAVELARNFHEAYERLAPEFGYETRDASAVIWAYVPETNKRLMVAVAEEILEYLNNEQATDTARLTFLTANANDFSYGLMVPARDGRKQWVYKSFLASANTDLRECIDFGIAHKGLPITGNHPEHADQGIVR